ncbi:hypothetical protein [Acinetobacter gyllenbergii]|uniref:Uncharacterized protein n=1 Tax=Acinetobacter gyllenbergii CIP 110306 = MTCC 11365 TaxID=1217657 RepID=A0A829HII5_9GAMM|nr:hypothetical protein [Acinetobacter gyllenbergii]EPF88120.1 hypothetical protein F957_01407 [Acinetobacter gyllenbergii CIP 110306 = MTCC 11365]EPH35804.1 hypothetical protein L293_0397 [Acinetobacter gyllenbergii CIP 110306 = MTCC 11365]
MKLYQLLSYRILPLFMCLGLSSSICSAKNLSLLLDKDVQESLITINGNEFIEKNQIKALANKSYQYFSVKKENGMIYEAYIRRCAGDYLKNLDKKEAKAFEICNHEVIESLDELMSQTKALRIHFTGSQYVYDGDENSTLFHYYSFVHVKNYYMTNDQKHPMYGVIYRCKVKAETMGLEEFVESAKNTCANTIAVSASSSLK